jgi:hypothetical protein
MCLCKNVEFGSYDVAIPLWYNGRKRVADIDVCISLEILDLWNKGIITIESCCGHNKQSGYIAVDKCCINQMLELGYKQITGKPDFFIPQKILSNETVK